MLCFQGIVKSIQRSICQFGDYMAVCKPDRTEGIQSQYGSDYKKQIFGGRLYSIREIIMKI